MLVKYSTLLLAIIMLNKQNRSTLIKFVLFVKYFSLIPTVTVVDKNDYSEKF